MEQYKGRMLVAKWLQVKASQESDTVDFKALSTFFNPDYGYGSNEERLRRLLGQLSADAAHSDLLWRLFSGEEPR